MNAVTNNSKLPRLGVNIDHVATLRQARGEIYPSVVDAAKMCLEHGADQITIHLREDRRHIQDTDVEAVRMVTQRFAKPLNLEMGCSPEIIEVAIATAPDWVCLVPEHRQEQTTEGGLMLKDPAQLARVRATCEKLRKELPALKISLFMESDIESLKFAHELKVDAVEIHTGEYAKARLNGEEISGYLESYQKAYNWLKDHNIACHAGHGLTDQSVKPLLAEGLFAEYNVGHWIVAQSVFEGLGKVVQDMKWQFNQHPLKG